MIRWPGGSKPRRPSPWPAIPGGNPTALCLGLLGVGRALQRKDPAAALALLDESAEAAASVSNRWFYAFARMYAAATHGMHSDPVMAATAFLEVLDVWDRLGDWSQQWLSLLYLTRLLIRIDAPAEAVTLHHALVAAAKPAPFDADRLAAMAAALGTGGSTPRPGGDRPWTGRRSCVRPIEPARPHRGRHRRLSSQAAARPAATGRTIPRRRRERRGHDRADQHRQPGREIGQRYTPGEPGPDHRRERRRYRVVEQPPRRGRQPRGRRRDRRDAEHPGHRADREEDRHRSPYSSPPPIEHGADRDARDDPGQQPELARGDDGDERRGERDHSRTGRGEPRRQHPASTTTAAASSGDPGGSSGPST